MIINNKYESIDKKTSSLKKKKLSVFMVGLFISFLTMILAIQRIDFNEIIYAILNTDIFLVIMAILIKNISFLFMSFRWQILLGVNGINYIHLFKCIVIGCLPNFLFLNTGPLPRLLLLKRFSTVGYSDAIGSIIIEKIIDSALMIVMVILSIFYTPLGKWFNYPSVIKISIISFTIFIVILLICLRFEWLIEKSKTNKIIRKYSIFEFLLGFKKYVILFFQQRRRILKSLGYSIIISFCPLITIYLVMASMNIKESIMVAFLLQVALLVGNRIPSVGGIGIFQYVCVLVLAEISVESSTAIAFSIVLQFIFKIPPVVMGTIILPSMFNKSGNYK